MNWRTKLIEGAVVTVYTGTAVLVGNGVDLLDAEPWKLAVVAGLGGLVGFIHQTAGEIRDQLRNRPYPGAR